jgi:[acyl-carrier-protein] S-malonyltransferase
MEGARRYAVLFPGQGSQHERMEELVMRHAPDLAAIVCDELGDDPFARLGDGTRFVQPAVFLASVAGWRAVQPTPEGAIGFAGHSMGELAALVAGGALDAADGARLVVRRAIITEEVALSAGGGMLALLGVARDRAAELADAWGLEVANDNCPGQTVLSGGALEIAAAQRHAEALEVNYRRLAVDGPFHSSLMAHASVRFGAALADVTFHAPAIPVLSCVSAAPFYDPRRELASALVRQVRWHDTTLELNRRGAVRFVEMPPGKVLIGLVRRSLRRERPALEAMDRVAA